MKKEKLFYSQLKTLIPHNRRSWKRLRKRCHKTTPPLRTTVTPMRRLKRNTGRKLERTVEEAMMRRPATLQP